MLRVPLFRVVCVDVRVARVDSGGGRLEVRVVFDRESLRLSETPFAVFVEFDDWPIVGEFGGPALPRK